MIRAMMLLALVLTLCGCESLVRSCEEHPMTCAAVSIVGAAAISGIVRSCSGGHRHDHCSFVDASGDCL